MQRYEDVAPTQEFFIFIVTSIVYNWSENLTAVWMIALMVGVASLDHLRI